jgi:pyruvate/2-oxoglutarate dehydrogenase complex dihydrolipoamide acyltransferase (E2) component
MDVKVAENLWSSSMLPEGIVERWFVASGAIVKAGERLAEVRIEDALHEITAPISGRLTIESLKNDVVEPGSVLGQVEPQLDNAA